MQVRLMDARPLSERPRVAEFFAGMGLVRAGLEQAGFEVVWANDFDPKKAQLYRAIYGDDDLVVDDIHNVEAANIPDVDLVTASFPCTDLSLAGNRKGLKGSASGTILRFLEILAGLKVEGRLPQQVLLENVVGFLSSHGGDDYRRVIHGLQQLGYHVSPPIKADAATFTGQSRPRVFVVGDLEAQRELEIPEGPGAKFADVVDRLRPEDPSWWDAARQAKFRSELSGLNQERLATLQATPGIHWRTAYRRVRNGDVCWEIRDDHLAGCLRALRGGSSKQAVVEIDGNHVRTRWMSAKEYCHLQGFMKVEKLAGIPDSQIQFAAGDAVCVPLITALARQVRSTAGPILA